MDKADFVINLLDNPKLNNEQRLKLLKLAKRDYVNSEERINDIIDRLKKIENNQPLKIENNTEVLRLVRNPNPLHVAEFMSLFNQRDGLKYLTHAFDEPDSVFNTKDYLSKTEKKFKNITSKYNHNSFSIPSSLYRVVNEFAFQENPKWYGIDDRFVQKEINTGWKKWDAELLDKNQHPSSIESYQSVINDFKRLTRIKSSSSEGSKLEDLIDKVISSVFAPGELELLKSDLGKADFYTHVSNLMSALELIFTEIKNNRELNVKIRCAVKLEREFMDGYALRKIKITHYDSFPTKELSVLLKEWPEKGNMGAIYKKLEGFCHWSIMTKVEGKPYAINILRDISEPAYGMANRHIEGFTHILTFYYK
jgi:hypothetical protein